MAFPLLILTVCSLSSCWACSVVRNEYVGSSQCKPVGLLENLLLVIFYTLVEPHIHSPPPRPALAQGDIYTNSWSTQLLISVYLNQRPATLWSPLCWDKVSFFALFFELHGHIRLTHLHPPFFHCRGSFCESHSTLCQSQSWHACVADLNLRFQLMPYQIKLYKNLLVVLAVIILYVTSGHEANP